MVKVKLVEVKWVKAVVVLVVLEGEVGVGVKVERWRGRC